MSSNADTAHPTATGRLAELCARGEQLARQREAQAEPVIEHYDRVYEEPVPESVVADQHAALARMSPGARRLHAELTADGKVMDDDPWWTDEDGNRHRGPSRSDATRRTVEYARIHREGLARAIAGMTDTAPHLTAAYYDRELSTGEVIPHIPPYDDRARRWLTDYLIEAGVNPTDMVHTRAYDIEHGTRHFEDMLTWAAVDSMREAHEVLDEYEAFTKTDATLAERQRRGREMVARLRELGHSGGEAYLPGRSYMWERCHNIERASGYEPAFLHLTPLELKQYAQPGRAWAELRRDLIRTGVLRTRAEHAVRAVERYLYRASMRVRAGGLEQAIHGPPSPDDFGIPTAHLVTATVAPSHAGPLAR